MALFSASWMCQELGLQHKVHPAGISRHQQCPLSDVVQERDKNHQEPRKHGQKERLRELVAFSLEQTEVRYKTNQHIRNSCRESRRMSLTARRDTG